MWSAYSAVAVSFAFIADQSFKSMPNLLQLLSAVPLAVLSYAAIVLTQRLLEGRKGRDLLTGRDDWAMVNVAMATSIGLVLSKGTFQ